MRLLHLIHTPRHSGAEMLVNSLCRVHTALGHHSAVASFGPAEHGFEFVEDLKESPAPKTYVPELETKKLRRTLLYRTAVEDFVPDVIFAHSVLPSMYGRLATGIGKTRTPFVSVLHAVDDYAGAAFRLAERLTSSRVDAVVAVSQSAADNYTRRCGNAPKVNIIANGIDAAAFLLADRDRARAKYQINDQKRILLQVGRLYKVKQQHLSIQAAAPILRNMNATLWLAGPVESREYELELQRTIRDLRLEKHVTLLGARRDIPDLLAAADLFLMPSRHEAQGLALLEALASGIAVVASDIPPFRFASGMPHVTLCRQEDAAAWQSAIEHMLGRPRVNRDLSSYSMECTARAYIDLAEHLVEQRAMTAKALHVET